MRRLKADCGVMGEGERAFQQVLTCLEKGQPLAGIDGVIAAQKNSTPAAAAPTKAIARLGELPPPAHDLCHYSRYTRGGGFVGVQTKRGCPFKCSYCIYPQLEGRRYRLRPPEAVVEEVEKVFRESKVRDFFFVDSVFNDPRKHALAVCRELPAASCQFVGTPFAIPSASTRNWRGRWRRPAVAAWNSVSMLPVKKCSRR